MKSPAVKSLVMSLFVTCCFAATNGIADDRFIKQDTDGFCTSFRVVENGTLTKRIRAGRSTLQQRQATLAQRVSKQKFSGLDALITIVMPGGLLYAAIKRSNQLVKRQELTQLTQDINQLTGDLLTLESASGKLQIATFQK